MSYLKKFFGFSIYTKVPRAAGVVLSVSLFVLLLIGYIAASEARHTHNPTDKILPTVAALGQGVGYVLNAGEDGRSLLVVDTLASLRRLGIGVGVSLVVSIFFGMYLALFPFIEAVFLRFFIYFGKIPPLAILPIIFIFYGLGEATKILLMCIGLVPAITLDIYFQIKALPREQFVKALTLGAAPRTIMWQVVLPQMLPVAFTTARLQLLNAWLFLIAAEAIAASSGLGYRIFLVRRYLAMDIIIPYVLWIALLSFSLDAAIACWVRRRYPWFNK